MSCAARDELIGELVRAAGELRAEVTDLKHRLGRNSGNSPVPPSADDLPGRVPPRREGQCGADRALAGSDDVSGRGPGRDERLIGGRAVTVEAVAALCARLPDLFHNVDDCGGLLRADPPM
jgi:hypothetical protein